MIRVKQEETKQKGYRVPKSSSDSQVSDSSDNQSKIPEPNSNSEHVQIQKFNADQSKMESDQNLINNASTKKTAMGSSNSSSINYKKDQMQSDVCSMNSKEQTSQNNEAIQKEKFNLMEEESDMYNMELEQRQDELYSMQLNGLKKRRKNQIIRCTYPGCHQKFKKYNNYKVHLRIHKNVKPFQCEYCQKDFTQKCNLIKHLRFHIKKTPQQDKNQNQLQDLEKIRSYQIKEIENNLPMQSNNLNQKQQNELLKICLYLQQQSQKKELQDAMAEENSNTASFLFPKLPMPT